MLLEIYGPFPGAGGGIGGAAHELLGLILSCLANYREQVRQEALLVIGQQIFGSPILAERDKSRMFSLCAKKLLFLLNENKGGELSLYYRAATLVPYRPFYRPLPVVRRSGGDQYAGEDRIFPGNL